MSALCKMDPTTDAPLSMTSVALLTLIASRVKVNVKYYTLWELLRRIQLVAACGPHATVQSWHELKQRKRLSLTKQDVHNIMPAASIYHLDTWHTRSECPDGVLICSCIKARFFVFLDGVFVCCVFEALGQEVVRPKCVTWSESKSQRLP